MQRFSCSWRPLVGLTSELSVLASTSSSASTIVSRISTRGFSENATPPDEPSSSPSSSQPSLDPETVKSFLAQSREYKRSQQMYQQQKAQYDLERRNRINAWRVEFMLKKGEEERRRLELEAAARRRKAEKKALAKASKASPEAQQARVARERLQREERERQAAHRVIRYYAIKSVRDRFEEAYEQYLRNQSGQWVTDADLERRVQQALDSPVPLWREEDEIYRESAGKKPFDVKRENQ